MLLLSKSFAKLFWGIALQPNMYHNSPFPFEYLFFSFSCHLPYVNNKINVSLGYTRIVHNYVLKEDFVEGLGFSPLPDGASLVA